MGSGHFNYMISGEAVQEATKNNLYKYVFFITLTTTKMFMQSTIVQQVFEEQSITLINFQSTK